VFSHQVISIDAADVETLMWYSDDYGYGGGPSQFDEYFDVVVDDRSPGGGWSGSRSSWGPGTWGPVSLR
jgi:hypothetical protein